MDELIKYTNYSKLKCNTRIKYFLYVSISILIILCVMIHNISIPNYYYSKTIITKYSNKKVLKIVILDKDMDKILKNNKLIINKRKYIYKVEYISEVIIDDKYNSYYEIYLDCNLNNEIENSIYEVKIKYEEKLLNKIIFNFVVGR